MGYDVAGIEFNRYSIEAEQQAICLYSLFCCTHEAMACGCPVVVSNVASLPGVCGDAAQYVDSYNIEGIAEGIHKVLTDEALRQGMIERGLERVKFFSWEKSARAY